MMEKFPRQPHTLEKEDRDTLGVIGHRIELWNTARTGDGSLSERQEALTNAIQAEVNQLLHSTFDISPVELAELEEDLEQTQTFDGDEQAFLEFCRAHEEYYREVRAHYIEQLNPNTNTN